MANLSKAVNTATKEVLKSEGIQSKIEQMQIDLLEGGTKMYNAAIGPVWRAFVAMKDRLNAANANNVTLIGDYKIIADKFAKVLFVGMTFSEITDEILKGHKDLQAEANKEQAKIIADHSALEARVVAGRLTSIASFLKARGFETSLSEDVVQAGETAEKLYGVYLAVNNKAKKNPNNTRILSREQWEQERAKIEEKKRQVV